MGYRILADLILTLHLCFILFVLFGGLLCLFRTGLIWLHLPAVTWGVWVEWSGQVCPLTPLENHFRQAASGQGFDDGFVAHYLLPIIYPQQLDSALQWVLVLAVVIVNLVVYFFVFIWLRKRRRAVD